MWKTIAQAVIVAALEVFINKMAERKAKQDIIESKEDKR